MLFEDEQLDKATESEFEVAFKKEPRKKNKPKKVTEERMSLQQIKPKIDLYNNSRTMYDHLKDSYIKQAELIVVLPEQLQAKYILKSVTYLADEWLTLKTSFIRQGDAPNKLIIDLEQLSEEQIANMCAELHECIDHFVARTMES